MRTFSVILPILLAGSLFGQAPDAEQAAKAFEVADIHTSPASTNPTMRGGLFKGGRYELRNATMVDLIRTAYNIDAQYVVGGAAWLDSDRFDVIAKGPANATAEDLRSLLKALLADRFKLVAHQDKRPVSVYTLTAGKHPQLKESTDESNSGCRPEQPNGPPAPGSIPNAVAICHHATMATLAMMLPQMAGAYFQGNQVVDMTGLTGAYDFTITWTGRGLLAAAGADGISIYDAVDKELGLKLEMQKVPMPVIVVDSVNEKPTDNLPGVTANIPPVPTEFEVADIKPSEPGSTANGQGFLPGGRIDVRNITLKQLIQVAWTIQNDDLLVNQPKWLGDQKFDLVAKVAAPPQANAAMGMPPIDVDTLRIMLRGLLAERFHLATHTEDQPVSVYAIVAVKPKLTKADPSNRPGCRNIPAPATGTSAAPFFTIQCQNVTMAQVVDRIQGFAASDVNHPIIDATGLEGSWDFTLSFTPQAVSQQTIPGRDANSAGGASVASVSSDPSGAPNLMQAVEKQLGLKLELQKHPMPVLVIDHVDQKPTDN